MSLVKTIKETTARSLEQLYKVSISADDIAVNQTKPEFEGDYTVVLFSFVKQFKKSPEQLGNELGQALASANPELITGFNVIKGFLNLSISDPYFTTILHQANQASDLIENKEHRKIIVEYSSPNTNKPLHL